jgi:hypothetical protein
MGDSLICAISPILNAINHMTLPSLFLPPLSSSFFPLFLPEVSCSEVFLNSAHGDERFCSRRRILGFGLQVRDLTFCSYLFQTIYSLE